MMDDSKTMQASLSLPFSYSEISIPLKLSRSIKRPLYPYEISATHIKTTLGIEGLRQQHNYLKLI